MAVLGVNRVGGTSCITLDYLSQQLLKFWHRCVSVVVHVVLQTGMPLSQFQKFRYQSDFFQRTRITATPVNKFLMCMDSAL